MKQPYCFEVGEGDVFALAGLWDEWKSPEVKLPDDHTIKPTSVSVGHHRHLRPSRRIATAT
jgi:putative SOS response-associated peptidase YedK